MNFILSGYWDVVHLPPYNVPVQHIPGCPIMIYPQSINHLIDLYLFSITLLHLIIHVLLQLNENIIVIQT